MLKSGSSGEDVTKLQNWLRLAGFKPGKTDGVFGARTESALKAFQEANDLQADGIAGPKTMSALRDAARAEREARRAAAGDAATDEGDDATQESHGAPAVPASVVEKVTQIVADKAGEAGKDAPGGFKGV